MNSFSFNEIIEKINSHFATLTDKELENNLLAAGSAFYKEYEGYSCLTYSLTAQHFPPPK